MHMCGLSPCATQTCHTTTPACHLLMLLLLLLLPLSAAQEWLTRMLLSTYRCWDRFSVTHWSSLLPALVLLKVCGMNTSC